MPRLALFAYGSLVDPESAAQTLGRPVSGIIPVRMRGWQRRWSQVRDNLKSEKTFARAADGTLPRWVLGLNIEPGGEDHEGPNGTLIEVTEAELDRLDMREIRYERVDVTGLVLASGAEAERASSFDGVVTYTARPESFAAAPPGDAVVLTSYLTAVEGAFAALGSDELELYRRTTAELPAPVVEGVLVKDEIPAGNPRRW